MTSSCRQSTLTLILSNCGNEATSVSMQWEILAITCGSISCVVESQCFRHVQTLILMRFFRSSGMSRFSGTRNLTGVRSDRSFYENSTYHKNITKSSFDNKCRHWWAMYKSCTCHVEKLWYYTSPIISWTTALAYKTTQKWPKKFSNMTSQNRYRFLKSIVSPIHSAWNHPMNFQWKFELRTVTWSPPL